MKLQGIFPPIATPFDRNGDLYKAKVQANVEQWNKTGLAGYVVCGSTGESVYLTMEEKFQLWEWVAAYAAPDKLLMAGTGVESVRKQEQTRTTQAVNQYELIYRQFPNTERAPEAKYRIGMLEWKKLKDYKEAKNTFSIVMSDYPDSPWADSAREAYDQIDRELLTARSEADEAMKELEQKNFTSRSR